MGADKRKIVCLLIPKPLKICKTIEKTKNPESIARMDAKIYSITLKKYFFLLLKLHSTLCAF